MAIAVAGCSGIAVREPTTAFQDTSLRDDPTLSRVALPLEPDGRHISLDGEEVWVVSREQFLEWIAFVEAARSNEIVLDAREDQIRALTAEVNALIRAGRLTEELAGTYYDLYRNEVGSCELVKAGAIGVSALSFILLGIGSL